MKKEELVQLVDRITLENLRRIEPKVRENLHIKTRESKEEKEEFYEIYLQRLKQIQEKDIRGKPDTFIKAACMCEALIKFKCVVFEGRDEKKKESIDLEVINYQIALEVACAMLRSANIFEDWADEIGFRGNGATMLWEKIPARIHRDNEVKIPTGVIPNSPLKERIVRNLLRSDLYLKNQFDTMSFSDTLHLIYLCN